MMSSHLCLQIVRPKKLLIFNVNNVLCYFLPFVVWDGNARVFGRNINKSKMKVSWREHLFFNTLKYFYIVNWFYVKLEDVLEVLAMFIPENFLDQFVFIWGCEQCSKTFGDSWQWIQQDALESKVEWSFSWIIQGTNVVKKTACNGWTSHFICGHLFLNCHWPRRFEFIIIVWSNILNFV